MQVINAADKKKYNNFVGRQKHSQFLQSWEWGEFHKKVSDDVRWLGVLDNEQLVAAAVIIKKQLPMGKSYFYCPRGPVVRISDIGFRISDLLFDEIKKIARDEGVMFLRFDPTSEIRHPKSDIRKTLDVQPSKTLMLNLAKPEKELLKNMRQKTRYNVRLAEKKGVKIIDAGLDRFEDFWRLMGETSERDNFRAHGRNYYKAMLADPEGLRARRPSGSAMAIKLFIAEYRGKPIAASIVSFFGDTAAYMHGASGADNRNVMAPYLLQWHAIKLGKKLGCKYYDFYGIDEEKWPGVTRFKKGFGGRTVNYPGTFDLIFDSGWYNVYKMVRRVRRTF